MLVFIFVIYLAYLLLIKMSKVDTELNDKIKDIESTLTQVSFKLNEVSNTLHDVNYKIDKINKSTKNMDEHISFVEAVYSSVSNPFYYILNKVSRQPVKQIEMKKDTN